MMGGTPGPYCRLPAASCLPTAAGGATAASAGFGQTAFMMKLATSVSGSGRLKR